MSIYKDGKLIAGGSQALPLLCFMWSDHQLNHPSWLNSTTFSWQSGAVYQAAYAHLTADITGKTLQSETISGTTIQFYLADDGHKICPASEESNVTAIYNATGVAWYYIIDTTNQRFKLPRSKHNKYATTNPVAGTGMAMGITDGTYTGVWGSYGGNTISSNSFLGATVGTNVYNGYAAATNQAIGVVTDETKSGMVAKQEQDTDQYKYLYFYVGNFTQTALENTAGVTTEVLNTKVTVGHEVVEFQAPTAANNYTWYRKYADGWIEQGGFSNTSSGTVNITLPIVMADNNYSPRITQSYAPAGADIRVRYIQSCTTTTIYTSSASGVGFYWQVSGMAA